MRCDVQVGIFPYVLKLLQTTSAELRNTLVFIWWAPAPCAA
jgi:regulator-associated protein of mTOR